MKIPFLNYELRSTKKPRPEDWDDFWYSKQPYDNSTGIDVNEDVALTYSAVWACVKVISEDLASLPLFLYRRNGKSKERSEDHRIFITFCTTPQTLKCRRYAVQRINASSLADMGKRLRRNPAQHAWSADGNVAAQSRADGSYPASAGACLQIHDTGRVSAILFQTRMCFTLRAWDTTALSDTRP